MFNGRQDTRNSLRRKVQRGCLCACSIDQNPLAECRPSPCLTRQRLGAGDFLVSARRRLDEVKLAGAGLYDQLVVDDEAAEVAVGLALIVAIFRSKQSINIDDLHQMEG